MIRYIKSTLTPEAYHGHNKKAPFFEGWYFKLVPPGGAPATAIIPGIFKAASPESSQAFIQALTDRDRECRYIPFPPEQFRARADCLDVQIGANRFTNKAITLNVQDEQTFIRGTVEFEQITSWPVRLHSPGIMGWYAWAPFMQCYHGVVSLDHRLKGRLRIDGETVDFSGGRGYIEKDWGRAFPESWVWVQSNHFPEAGISLTASLAIIPWIRGAFPGFIIGVLHQERLYRFATYTGAKIEQLELSEQHLDWVVADKRHRLSLRIHRGGPTGLLRGPASDGMTRRIEESLAGKVELRLCRIDRRGESLIIDGTGKYAGMEMAGDLPKLIGIWKAQVNSRKS